MSSLQVPVLTQSNYINFVNNERVERYTCRQLFYLITLSTIYTLIFFLRPFGFPPYFCITGSCALLRIAFFPLFDSVSVFAFSSKFLFPLCTPHPLCSPSIDNGRLFNLIFLPLVQFLFFCFFLANEQQNDY